MGGFPIPKLWLWGDTHAERRYGTAPTPRGLIFRYRTTIVVFNLLQSLITRRYELSKHFFGRKKDIKGLFRGKKRNKDKEGPGTIAEGADLEESPSRSESPFVGGGDRDLKGSGSNLVGGQFSSADRPEQRDKSEPVPAGGKTNQGDGEEGADQIELSQAQRPRPHSNVKAVVGGGHGEKAGQVPSDI